MAELAARREARRLKILQQSENRLKKISGVEQRSTTCELDGIVQNHVPQEVETSLFNNIYENHASEDLNTFSVENHARSSEASRENAQNSLLCSESEQRTTPLESVSEILSKYRTKIITALAVLLSFTLFILEGNFIPTGVDSKLFFLNKIFLPLLCFEMIDIYHKNVDSSTPDIFTSLLLMSNSRVNPSVVLFVTRYLKCLTQIVQDVMVYFFVFNASQFVLHTIFV